jgi:hypothetical protein
MVLRNGLLACVALGSAVCAVPAQAQDLTGDTISCLRNGVNGCSASSAVVGPGIEFTQGAGTFDFSDTGVTLVLTSGLNTSPLIYSFTDTTSPFISFSNVLVSGGTFDTSRISLTNGILSFDVGGIDPIQGTTVSLALATASVPEPGTWMMMIIGFGAIGFAARRRASVRATVRYS